ncbi:MAG: Xaa-Pro peptidase family protein [Proteobacteria bacterium]|nr:Xaa-Pro peptidase family protein [Pseudomonadota bacterium]
MLKSLNICDLTPKAEIEDRIEKLKQRMTENNIDFAVILQNVDMFYFTGTLQKGVLVVPVDGDPLLFIEKTMERAVYETPLNVIPIRRDRDVKSILADRKVLKGRGAMEFDVLPVSVFERWKGLLGFENFVDFSLLIKDVRLIKSPFEIAQIKKSGEIVSRVFERAKDVVKEGISEVEIGAILETEGRISGHQGFLRMRGLNQEMMNMYVTHGLSATIQSHGDVPISGVGITHAIAQGSSINRVEKGIPVLIDYGGGYNGYITDETRPYVAGTMKDIFQRGYDVAREIIEDTGIFAREGVNGTEIFMRAMDKAKKAQLEDYFMGYGDGKVGFIGHGLGLEINELPVITPRHDIILKEGMVFAFEPKFIIPGEGAIGIEVDFIVRKDGLERVTNFPIDVVYV